MNHYLIALFILLPAMIIAPATRLAKPHQAADSVTTIRPIPGLQQVGAFPAANQGPYQITALRHQACEGSIALLPLHRNAEGSAILRQMYTRESVRHGIIFDDRIHARFPQAQFSWHQLKERVFKAVRLEHQPAQPIAFAEAGQCDLAELVALHL